MASIQFILEITNVAITIIFLLLFVLKLVKLRHSAVTGKYSNYYPKLRILFSAIYIVLSVGLMLYNCITNAQPNFPWYEYLIQGGGQCFNSIILVMQLLVLREELKKERPYTSTHIIYFLYLAILSVTRFILFLLQVINNGGTADVGLAISIILLINCFLQLGYWLAKRQSLPQFRHVTPISFAQFRKKRQSDRCIDLSNRSIFQQPLLPDEGFEYLYPVVKIERGKFLIILSILSKKGATPSQLPSPHRSTTQQPKSEIINQSRLSVEQVIRFYSICGRFSLKQTMKFANVEIRQIAEQLQKFMQQLFREKRAYQSLVLKCLKIPTQKIKEYSALIEKDNLDQPRQSEIDSTLGIRLVTDKNSIYLSVHVFQQLWVDDHYQFYMKVSEKHHTGIFGSTSVSSGGPVTVYPMRRYSQFEELHHSLKTIIASSRNIHAMLQLPALPKKHLYLHQSQINDRRKSLEGYLKRLSNDFTIMCHGELQQVILKFVGLEQILQLSPCFETEFFDQLEIVKGGIVKTLIQNELVTFYEFQLYRNALPIKRIAKRFREFVELQNQLLRWMNNIQVTYRLLALPEKHLYKSETNRHDKLRTYLQNIIEIKEIYKNYQVNCFFNAAECSSDLNESSLSAIGTNKILYELSANRKNASHEIELEIPPRLSLSDSQRLSECIEELGESAK